MTKEREKLLIKVQNLEFANTMLQQQLLSKSNGDPTAVSNSPLPDSVEWIRERNLFEDKSRRDMTLIYQLKREMEYVRSQRDSLLQEQVLKSHNISSPIVDRSIVTRPISIPTLSIIGSSPMVPQPKQPYPITDGRMPANSDAVALAAATTTNTFIPMDPKLSQIHGYCSSCERAVPVRIARRCSRCHTEDIADTKDEYGCWTSLIGIYANCVHTKATRCENKRWEFVGICHLHPNKAPDPHCPLLPGVIHNTTKEKCGGCDRIEPIVLRFGCGHFICLPKCWRNYMRTKLDNRELLFDKPQQGADATLSCPHGCRHYVQSENLFKSTGKARFEQYQTLRMYLTNVLIYLPGSLKMLNLDSSIFNDCVYLCVRMYIYIDMEHLVGRLLTPESTDGRLELKVELPVGPLTKTCKIVWLFS